jgi:site-specific recombinase XerD
MTEPARLYVVGQTTATLFAPLLESWTIALVAEGKSDMTVEGYMYSLQDLTRWLDDTRGATGPDEITTDLCRRWLAHQQQKNSPATAKSRWTGLRSFCKWMEEEGELTPSPMATVKSPHVPEKAAEMLTLGQVRQLLQGCEGPLLVDRRDVALISLYGDTGARLSEVALLAVDDVDLRAREARLMGKGRRERIVPFGASTARAIDRYKRLRDRQPYAHIPALWLSGKDGRAMTPNAVQQMFRRRGRVILAMPNLHPHMLRHTFADTWLTNDGQEGDLMQLAGWRSRQMLTRYAAKTRSERARAAYQGRSPMDQL